MASTTKKLLMNVPATVNTLQYLDVVPGTYGAQLKLKGTVDGEPNVGVYLPGKLWAVVKAFKTAGVIAQDTVVPEEVTEATAVPFEATTFTLTNKQVEGQKYANLDVRVVGAVAPATKRADPTPDWLKEEDGWESVGGTATAVATPPVAKAADTKLAALFALHDACLKHAITQTALLNAGPVTERIGDDPDAVSARAATLFIQAMQQGIRA